MTPPRHVWHLWPGRHWPALPEEEHQFVADLERAALEVGAGNAKVERYHHTAVLNALRCGLTAAQLLELIPGSRPQDLLTAYVTLERERMQSWLAWREIVEDPTWETVTHYTAEAKLLLPVPVARVVTIASQVRGPHAVAQAVRDVNESVQAHVRAAEHIEHMLAARTPPDPVGVNLGVKLHNPKDPGVWGHPYFLPSRVGNLSPNRVRDLLGERA
jgi:hypothetical protein